MKAFYSRALLCLTVGVVCGCFPKKLEPLETDPKGVASVSSVSTEAVFATIATLKFSVVNPSAVGEYGFVYATSQQEPTHANNGSVTRLGSRLASEEVTASLDNLKPRTTYFIAPFVKDGEGYKYGKAQRIETRSMATVIHNPGSASNGLSSSAKGYIFVFSTLFALNNEIYALTSDSRQGYGYAAMQKFIFSSREWREVGFPANGLNRRTDATSFTLGNKAYVGFGTGNLTDIYSYQADQNRWESVKPPEASPNVPAFRAVGGIGYTYNGKGYVWNGTWTEKNNPSVVLWNDGTYGKVVRSDHIPFWEYDPGSGGWTLRRAGISNDFLATLRQSPFYFVLDDRLYLGGGQALHDPGRRSEVWELNLKDLTVKSVTNLPAGFIYQNDNSNGNHRNLAAGLQGVGWKRGYVLDVVGNLFVMDVTDPGKVSFKPAENLTGIQHGHGTLVSVGQRLFFLEAGNSYQVIEIIP
ncbi:hypothetical protein [Larkinella soli]|uniref:hypothetical protein n=1 Tax=Larkinella soli TaxID=1770527 RepID=UPI000FFB2DCA|nr:hypothetical protein [Larkinella soli]